MTRQILPKIMVIDIDGTIAQEGARAQLLKQQPVDWDRFYEDDFDDRPNTSVCDFVRFMAETLEVIFCTSRRECVRQKTQAWLQKHLGMAPKDYTLIMRRNDDDSLATSQKWTQFKAETTEEERQRVLFVIEDDAAMASMWRLHGFTAFQVK